MDGTPGSGLIASPGLWTAFAVPALGAALAASGVVLSGGLRRDGGSEPEVVLGLAAAAVGAVLVLGWALAAGFAVLAVVAGRRRWGRLALVCRRCSPAVLRRAAATVLGLQLVGLSTASADEPASPFWGGDDRTPAHASPTPEPSVAGPTDAVPAPDDPAPAPDDPAPAGPAPDSPAVPPAPPDTATPVRPAPVPSLSERTAEGQVTVLHGDTLWSLAAAHLGPGATDAQIARCWPVWYELNRHVLLDGPHLLLPGQRLVVPGTGPAAALPPSTPSPPIPGGPS